MGILDRWSCECGEVMNNDDWKQCRRCGADRPNGHACCGHPFRHRCCEPLSTVEPSGAPS